MPSKASLLQPRPNVRHPLDGHERALAECPPAPPRWWEIALEWMKWLVRR